MIRRISMAALAFTLAAAPLSAQSMMHMRVDRSTNEADPDDVPDVTFTPSENGFTVGTGPAVVLWRDANQASGSYTLSARFTLLEPSNHTNYYGFVYGGNALDGERQNYLYFLIAQDGTYLVKHRANNETVHTVVEKTASDVINTPGADGMSVNDLEVRVGESETEFLVNGTVVQTLEKSGMAGRTDGLWGFRINHVMPGVRVENIRFTPGM